MKFSERIGITPIRTQLQLDSIDERLRTQLWNCYLFNFSDKIERNVLIAVQGRIWGHFLIKEIDQFDFNKAYFEIKYIFTNSEWYVTYNFLEFLIECQNLVNLKLESK